MSCVVQMPQQGKREVKARREVSSDFPPPATSDSRKSQGTAKSDSAQPPWEDLAMAKKLKGKKHIIDLQ